MKRQSPLVVHLKLVRRSKKPTADKPVCPQHDKKRDHAGPPAERKGDDPDSIRSAWVMAFGHRLREHASKGFILDGTPIDLDALMILTNRIRRDAGLPPVGRKPAWLR